jgi:hypothetical protein
LKRRGGYIVVPIVYLLAGFMATWLVIRFGENMPLLDLPETGWVRSFFWTVMIWIATYAVSALLGSFTFAQI